MIHEINQKNAGFVLYTALGFVILLGSIIGMLQAKLQSRFVPLHGANASRTLAQSALLALEYGQALSTVIRTDATATDTDRCRWNHIQMPNSFADYSYHLTALSPATDVVFVQTTEPIDSPTNLFLMTACAYDQSRVRIAQALWQYALDATPNWSLISIRQF